MNAKTLFDWVASGQQNIAGWRKCPTYDRGFLTPDGSRAVKQQVQRIALQHTAQLPLIWNIEHWPIPSEQYKLIEIIEWAREVRPDLRQSIYAMAPLRSYWAPVSLYFDSSNPAHRRLYENWQRTNDELKPLAAVMDFITPSLYTFYRDSDGHFGRQNEFWFEYARANIREARRYGKQVIPFMSPRYWAVPGWPPIAVEFFTRQMEFAVQEADGALMFDWVGNRPQIDLSMMMRAIAESI